MKITELCRRLALFAALVAATIGALGLGLPLLGLAQRATFSPGYVPMAPVTAVLCLLLSLVQAGQVGRPISRAGRRAALLVVGLTLVVGGLTLGQAGLGYQLPWDHWLSSPADTVDRFPLGRMSPVTAGVFLLTVAGLLGQTPGWASRAAARWLAALAPVGGLLLSGTIAFSYATGAPLFYTGELVPMALLTAVAFIALHGSLLLSGPVERWLQQSGAQDWAAQAPADNRDFSRRLLLNGCLLAALVLLTGVAYLRREQQAARQVVFGQLEAIARLKTEEIGSWRNERMGEARFLHRTAAVVRDLAAFAAAPGNPEARAHVIDWLNPIKGGDRYAVLAVLDPQGRSLLTIPAGETSAGVSPAALARALAAAEPVFLDLQRDPAGAGAFLDLLVPVNPPTPAGSGGAAPVALVLMRLDAQNYLFPLVQGWPLPSATAESMLVRREGDEVVYLNEVRHVRAPALTIRRPVGEATLSAAQAARGEYGVHEGVDYRGVPVLSAIHPIPTSPWILMAEMDQSEAYAPIRRDLWQTAAAVGLLLLALMLAGTAIWRWRHAEFLRRALQVEHERKGLAERLGLIMEHANDIILVFDERMRITEANERALSSYGRTLGEMRRLTARDLRVPERLADTDVDFLHTRTADGHVFETVHRRSDGTDFPVEVSSRPVEVDGRRHVLSIVRDITERKAQEAEIQRLSRIYFVISQVNQALVRAKDRNTLFAEVCRVLVEVGGFRIAWVGWLNPDTHFVEPVAVVGDTHGYVSNLRISADPAVPEGRGPSGISFREGRTYVCNDFFADPVTLPWRENARHCGFQSSIALPLRQDGRLVALLTVYAAEAGFFRPRQVELLEETAGNVAFALDVFAGEQRRREAEAAVQASQRRLQFLITATPAIIYSLGADGGYGTNFLSPNIREVLGYTPEEAGGADFWRLHVHPDDVAAANAAMAGLEPTGIVTREYRFRHADGAWRWMRDETRLVRDAAGRPAELVGYWIDISDRKLSEAQLLKLSQAIEQSPTSIVITDLDGAIEYVNPWFTKLTGYAFEEVRGQNPRVLKSGYTSPTVYTEMWRTLSEGRVWRGELQNKKKSGELYTELAVIAPILGPGGRTTHYVAIKDDITERKRADAAARQVLERFNIELEQKVVYRTEELASRNRQIEALLHAIPDTVMRLRSDGSLLFSKAAQGSPLLAAITPRENEPVRAAAAAELLAAGMTVGRRTLTEKSTGLGEAQISTPDGTVVLELRAAPTGTDEFVVFARDITERKHLEAETAALLEKEHQVSDMKTRFISVTSHEFRTPMAAAMGSVELLANHLDQLAPAKRTELFTRINTSLHRMTEMLDDVLTLNRIDADRMEVRLQPIDVALFLHNVVEEIRLGDRAVHHLELHTPADLPPFPTDVNLLHHILANLLSNAVRYSPAGGRVTVCMGIEGDRLRLTVEDQGIGVLPADRTRIFEPFERGANVGHIKGTGLGLNIVKRMTQLLGGTVGLEPAEGGGSRFTVSFPRLAPAEPSP